jgi:hypothetical protein
MEDGVFVSSPDRSNLKGPDGFRLDGVHRHPVNPFIEHPTLLLIVGGFGIGLALVSPEACAGSKFASQCMVFLELLGFGIAGVALTAYVIARYRRLAANSE